MILRIYCVNIPSHPKLLLILLTLECWLHTVFNYGCGEKYWFTCHERALSLFVNWKFGVNYNLHPDFWKGFLLLWLSGHDSSTWYTIWRHLKLTPFSTRTTCCKLKENIFKMTPMYLCFFIVWYCRSQVDRFKCHFDCLVGERHNSIADTLEVYLSCTNPWISSCFKFSAFWSLCFSLMFQEHLWWSQELCYWLYWFDIFEIHKDTK